MLLLYLVELVGGSLGHRLLELYAKDELVRQFLLWDAAVIKFTCDCGDEFASRLPNGFPGPSGSGGGGGGGVLFGRPPIRPPPPPPPEGDFVGVRLARLGSGGGWEVRTPRRPGRPCKTRKAFA